MSRSERLFHLAHLLGGRRSRPLREIVSQLEVSERTAYRDLAELGRLAPLTHDEHGYRLLETATLRPLNLTAEERAVLRLALSNPHLQRPEPLRRTLAGLEAKLEAVTKHVEETPEALQLAGPDTSGENAARAIAPLERAVRQRLEAEILYASLSGGTRRWRGVDPYRVFLRGDAWYLVGRCHVHDEPRIFRLDRIAEVRTLGVHFAPPRGFDLERFLADSWRVFVGTERHALLLRFDRALQPFIVNARQHPGERTTVLLDGRVEYRVELSSLEEVARWVLGFGGAVEVVEPAALRERVATLARGALARQAKSKR